jgi:hypothetical protein
MCMRRRIHVCSTGEEEYTEDERAAVEAHGGGAERECRGRSVGGVPARAKGLPSRLPETKGWGRGRGGKWVGERCVVYDDVFYLFL